MPITAEQREAFFKNLNNALGASLKGRKAEQLKNDELKCWLKCRGASVSRTRMQLLQW